MGPEHNGRVHGYDSWSDSFKLFWCGISKYKIKIEGQHEWESVTIYRGVKSEMAYGEHWKCSIEIRTGSVIRVLISKIS